MAEVDVAKLSALDLTCEHLNADGQPCKVKVFDVLAGDERDAPLLQRPDELLTLLRRAGVARVLSEPKIKTLSGRKASIEVGGSKLNATPTVRDDGRIALDIHAEHNEPMFTGLRSPPGNRQRALSFSVALESGKTAVANPFGRGAVIYPNGKPSVPPPIVIGFVRATLDNPMATAGNDVATTTSVENGKPSKGETTGKSDLKSLTIHLTVVEVNEAKLNRLGFEWKQISSEDQQPFSVASLDPLKNGQRISADQLQGFLKSLHQNGLARVLAEPTLITLDGRSADFNIGLTSITFVPSLLDEGRVKLASRLKTGDAAEITADDDLELGKLCLLRNTDMRLPGQAADMQLLVLARVDLLKSGQIPNLIGQPTYVEVRGRDR